MGRRVVKLNLIYKVIAAVLVLAGIASVAVNIIYADWDNRPSSTRLSSEAQKLTLPPESEQADASIFSKGTFSGAVVESTTLLTLEESTKHYLMLGSHSGWTLRSDQITDSRRKIVFCSNDLSRVISLRQQNSRTAIFAGTYWHSIPRSEKYCRTALFNQ